MLSRFCALVCYDWKCLGVGRHWGIHKRALMAAWGQWGVGVCSSCHGSGRCPFALWNPGQAFDWKPKRSMQKLGCKEVGNFSSPSEPLGFTCCYIQAEEGYRSRMSRVCGPGTLLVNAFNAFKACLFLFPGSVSLDLWVDFFEFVSPTVHLFLTLVT